MLKKLWIMTIFLLLFTACGRQPAPYWEQPSAQLSDLTGQEKPDTTEQIFAVWIPVMQYADWMTGKTEAQFRQSVCDAFGKCRDLGLNTVFLHVRAYQDAYYTSDLFPAGSYLTGDYDPLAIMTEEAHAAGLAVHAWINPLRGQTAEALSQTDSRYLLRQWYADGEKNGTRLVCVDGHYWLNPAYPEVRQLCADGAAEILSKYDVEGIHIDDYFYPTQDASFDAQAFAASGSSDLAAFRRENCSAMVKQLYDTVKAHDPDCIFSISPQGAAEINAEKLYADTARWASDPGFCDWILPQLYYGFQNETCPFEPTLAAWEQTAVSVRLIPGLAAYKTGAEDTWAGSGSAEWQNDPTVLSRETALLLEDDAVSGCAFYSYAALLGEADGEPERERIRDLLTKAGERN